MFQNQAKAMLVKKTFKFFKSNYQDINKPLEKQMYNFNKRKKQNISEITSI